MTWCGTGGTPLCKGQSLTCSPAVLWPALLLLLLLLLLPAVASSASLFSTMGGHTTGLRLWPVLLLLLLFGAASSSAVASASLVKSAGLGRPTVEALGGVGVAVVVGCCS